MAFVAGLGEIINSLFQEAREAGKGILSPSAGGSKGKGGDPEVASFEDVLTRMASQSDSQGSVKYSYPTRPTALRT